ncbi:hypothetical protein O3M35_007411 [Rhynocoris fuscipes]|uniref:Protein MIX23 n=1 Tax=Rhynocoris fuscipes TaxID=488301 RepID=A0AAW1DAX3_9HEMI
MECGDFLEFQDTLKKMRDVDDKLVYALNASVPSPSFRSQINPAQSCEELYNKLQENHEHRDKSIRNCINITSNKVQELKEKRFAGEDSSTNKILSKEQTKLRLLKSELGVEEVVRDRSLKLYYERCRPFYKPKDFALE